jgi:CheY-like chemotaxis protein
MPLTKNTEPLILNVDDSDAARYAKSRVLIRAGFNVIEAASGGEALQRARTERPTLMLLDVKLPDINGMEVCRMLKADPETQSILILQTSASFIGIADKIRALDGGADNYRPSSSRAPSVSTIWSMTCWTWPKSKPAR